MKNFSTLQHILPDFFAERQWQQQWQVQRLYTQWLTIIGPEVGKSSLPAAIRNQTLWLYVSHSIWVQEIHYRQGELLGRIKEVMPDCSITTDIIVGFPNETEEQFQDTLSLYEECEYDLAYTFIYSPREGTPAAKMQDNVPFEQKQDRLERLNEVVKEKALKQNQRFLNQVVDVLVDGPSKRDETMMTGYTAHQKLINFKGRKEDIGKIVPVKVTEVKTWALKGEQVD